MRLGISEAERGYLAGLLEGEGSFFVWRLKRKSGRKGLGADYMYVRPRISLTSTDRDVVYRLYDMTGGMGCVSKVKKPATYTGKPQWVWAVTADDAIEIMLTVRDLMGSRRQAKIDEVLSSELKAA